MFTLSRLDGNVDEPMNSPVASKRHTAVLTAVLVLVALAGRLSLRQAHGAAAAAGGSVALYAGLLAAEWGLVLYARAGLKRHGTSVARLISARPLTARTLVTDVMLGLLLLAALIGAQYAIERLTGPGDTTLVRRVLVTRVELVPLWLPAAGPAGVGAAAVARARRLGRVRRGVGVPRLFPAPVRRLARRPLGRSRRPGPAVRNHSRLPGRNPDPSHLPARPDLRHRR